MRGFIKRNSKYHVGPSGLFVPSVSVLNMCERLLVVNFNVQKVLSGVYYFLNIVSFVAAVNRSQQCVHDADCVGVVNCGAGQDEHCHGGHCHCMHEELCTTDDDCHRHCGNTGTEHCSLPEGHCHC